MNAALPPSDRQADIGPTYQELWDQYHAGRMSTCVLRELLRTDQVFTAFCKAKLRALRKIRDAARA